MSDSTPEFDMKDKPPQTEIDATQLGVSVTPVTHMLFEPESVEGIIEILRGDPEFNQWEMFGHVNVKTEGDYLLFNYAAMATYDGSWRAFERISRGLIIDKKRLIVMARPFDKFFNWGEGERMTDSPVEYATAKMDGSLGICWFDGEGETGTWRVTTRGSFHSEQALWATDFLKRYEHFLKQTIMTTPRLTLLVEIIYPNNRIVVDYGQFEGLVLIGARENVTGDYYNLNSLNTLSKNLIMPLAPDISTVSVTPLIQTLSIIKGVSAEGFVTVHENGERYKFKGADYLRLHKFITTLSFKSVLKSLADDNYIASLEHIPDEFLGEVKAIQSAIIDEVLTTELAVNMAYEYILGKPEYQDSPERKTFAKILFDEFSSDTGIRHFLFKRHDGKLTHKLILQKHDFSIVETGLNEKIK